MAITNISDFKVYSDEVRTGFIERLTQKLDVFNANSNGTILLGNDDLIGHYVTSAFFNSLASQVAVRQDITSNAAQTPLALGQAEHVAVKLYRKLKAIDFTWNAMKSYGLDKDDGSMIIGKMYADGVVYEMVNTALAALRAALSNTANVTNDVTGASTKSVTFENLLDTISLLGDNHERIAAWVMHSRQWFDLQKRGLTDGYETVATGVLNIHKVPAFGRPIIVTDSASLIKTADNPDSYFVMGLQPGACRVSKIGEIDVINALVDGNEQIQQRVQGEYQYTLDLKGFSYDKASTGVNPSDAAIATGSNWDKDVTSDYDLAGVVLKCQAAS